MIKIVLFLILTLSSLLFGKEICVDIDKNIQKNETIVSLYRKIDPQAKFLPKNKVEEIADQNHFFAKEFLKTYRLDKNSTIFIKLGLEKLLKDLYVEKLKKKYEPNEEILQSFYLDHKDSFKPEEKVSIDSITVYSLEEADRVYNFLKKEGNLSLVRKKFPSVKVEHFKNVPLSQFHFKIRDAVRKHKEGDIIGPFKIGNFYFIDQIVKKYVEKVDYNNLKKDIKNILLNIFIQKKLNEMYRRAKEK